MEAVLDAYALPRDEAVPLIAMDEASKELRRDLLPPLPMTPGAPGAGGGPDTAAAPGRAGTPARQDDKYERNGTAAVFMFFAPLLGWRRATCGPTRARADWAREVKRLLTVDFPAARKVRLVCDNLNTHDTAALYATFPAEEAHALVQRLEIVHTPRNGSWLNVAEIEPSVLSAQCLDRRIPDEASLRRELAAWTAARNLDASTVSWQFTTPDARVKLRRLYPQF